MQRRASVLVPIVMAPSLVDYTAGKAKKERAGIVAKASEAATATEARASSATVQPG